MKRRFLSLFGFFAIYACFVSAASAEGRCPPGFFPVGDIRTAYGCAPIPGYESNVPQQSVPEDTGPSTLQRPPGSWKVTWGAVGYSLETGIGGVALNNHLSKEEAEGAALKRCAYLGGKNCVLALTFYDQCGAVARSDMVFATGRSLHEDQAKNLAMMSCKEEGEKADAHTACNVTWSGCADRVYVPY